MKILSVLLIFMASVVGASAASLAAQADSAYNKEDYRLAVELYNRSIAANGVSSDIYYNLGNAWYRLDNLGNAVLNYERALRLDPSNSDARTNLEYVRSKITDKPEDDSSFFSNLHSRILNLMDADGWATAALIVFILLAVSVGLYVFANNVTLRKTGFFGGMVLIFVFAYFLFTAIDSVQIARSSNWAVVTASSTQLSSTPRASRMDNDKVVILHEGTKVEIIDSIATPDDPTSPMWYNVKINNSTKAWLRSSDVERI